MIKNKLCLIYFNKYNLVKKMLNAITKCMHKLGPKHRTQIMNKQA